MLRPANALRAKTVGCEAALLEIVAIGAEMRKDIVGQNTACLDARVAAMKSFERIIVLLAFSLVSLGCVSDDAGRIPTADETPGIDAPPAGKGPPQGFGVPEDGR